MAQDQENSYKLWQALSNDYDMGSYEQFKKDVQDATKRQKLYNAIKDEYDLPDFDGFSKQLGIVSTAAQQQPTGQTGAAVAGQTTSAGEMVAQGTAVDRLSDQMARKTGRMPEDVQQQAYKPKGNERQEINVYNTKGELVRADTAQNVGGKVGIVEIEKPYYTPSSTGEGGNRGYYVEKASTLDQLPLEPNEFGEWVAGWQRGERVKGLDKTGIRFMNMTGAQGSDEFDKYREDAEKMSDSQLMQAFNALSRAIKDPEGYASTREGYADAARLKAYALELRARDLGAAHDSELTMGRADYLAAMGDEGVKAEIAKQEQMSWPQRRAYLARALYKTMTSDDDNAKRVLLAGAAIRANETGRQLDEEYQQIIGEVNNENQGDIVAQALADAEAEAQRLDEAIRRRMNEIAAADVAAGNSIANALAGAESGPGGGMGRYNSALFSDPELSMLYASRHQLDERMKTLNRQRQQLEGRSGAYQFASAAWDALSDPNTLMFDLSSLKDAAVTGIYGRSGQDMTGRLQEARQSMLNNAALNNEIGQMYKASAAQRWGDITGYAIPYLAEFYLTGGFTGIAESVTEGLAKLGTTAAGRWVKGHVGEVGRMILRNTGIMLGDLTSAMVMANTIGAGHTGADIMHRAQGDVMRMGDGAFMWLNDAPVMEAILKGEAAQLFEYYTEKLGAHLDGLMGKAGQALGLKDLSNYFKWAAGKDIHAMATNALRRGGMNEFPSEVIEEEANLILNAMFVGDNTFDTGPLKELANKLGFNFSVDKDSDDYKRSIFNPETQGDIVGGMFFSIGAMRVPAAVYGTSAYYYYKHENDKAATRLYDMMGDRGRELMQRIDECPNEDIGKLYVSIVTDNSMTEPQARAAVNYINTLLQVRGRNLADMKDAEEKADEARANGEEPGESDASNDNEAYAEGYNSQGGEREGVQDDLQSAEQRLTDMGFDMGTFEGWTGDRFEEAIKGQDHGYSEEELSVIREYFRAKAASEGINQRVEDDIDTQVQQASDLVDKQTNQGTGMVHRAVLNEQHGSQEVFVTGGQLVMTGDGTMIDTEASDQSLFVYNPATGQPEQYTPQDFQSVEDPVNPEQLKSEAARDIRMSVEQQAQNDMNGVLPFQVGDTYEILTNGQPATVTVVEDQGANVAVQRAGSPEVEIVPKQQIQEAASAMKQAKRNAQMPATLPSRSAGARDNTAPKAAQNAAIPRQANAPVAPAAQSPALPMDETTGEPVWNKITPEQGYNHLTQSEMTTEDIGTMIDDRIAQADAAIEKASHGGTMDQRLQARQAKNYWEAVKGLHDAAMAKPAAASTTAKQSPTGQTAPAGTVMVEANQAETMPVGGVAVNVDGTMAEDRGQLGIRPEDEAFFLKTMSPRVMRLLDKVAKSLGWKIRLYNGENPEERGNYAKGVVWVNRRTTARELAQWILGHEMTHGMGNRTGRGETFKDYVKLANKLVRRQMGEQAYEDYIKRLIDTYKKHLIKLRMGPNVVTRTYIEEEIACDVTGDILMNNPEMIGKLFIGVENPGRVRRIIDMLVDAIDWIMKYLPFRSAERKALVDLSKRLNNLYRDAKAQTDIAKATAREEGSRIESGEGEREGKSFSITGNAEGSGFTASETVLEIWRVPQEDGTYKEEEHWVKKPLLDSEGNVVFRMGGREYSGNNPITVDDLKSNPDTILNYMLQDALRAGTIDEVKADQVRQQYADMLNLYLEKGLAENGGFENLENNWLWVGETVFRTVASNSDEQYSYSMDITKVCKKNEAVIRAISAMQVKTGYGVTPAQILEIYETTDSEGFQVPCPVCYVFSRYINNGKYATAIVNGMKKYGKYLPGQAEAKPVEWWVKEFKDAQARAEKMKTPLKNANDDVKVILQQIDALCREITSGKLSKEEAESKRRHVRALDQRYRAALDVISQEALPRWIKAFVIEGSDQGGWSLREDAALPEDMDDFTLHALDIRKTASAMEKYPSLTRYRRAGGSAGGKEITFASNNELGTIAMGLGISKDKLDDYPNYYQLAAEASTDEERQALLQKARERFDKARLYAQRQTLRGGQRMWSWSDNIESLSSDVASNLMQLELLGGALQTYSKQLEGVKMVAAMNGYVNASLMGYGDGIREVGPDEIENGRLKDDIWDVNNKGRRRIIANAGSPVYHNEADGKDYVLVFDDVVGIDPFGHDGKRGLFSLNEEYDRAGNILVGMNDIHVRAAMADPSVFFIIPWHASGMSNHILKQMFNILGVNMDQFVSTDYTKMQEETNYLLKKDDGSPKKKVPKEVEDFWDSHTYEDEFACGTGHIENGDRDGGLSDSQKHYRALRDAIFDGAVKEGTEEYDQIMADEFLSQVYRQVTTRVADGKMTEKDKEFIYPYEYWQMTEVDENGNEVPARVENADVNGRRYVEYCRRMGFKPKFTGKYDDKTGYSPEGNFADDPGYWKLLIDRRMYDRRGNYQDLTPVDSSGLDSSMYDPDQTSEEFNVTEVATNEGAEKIADAVYQNDIERTGSMPAPNLDMTMDEAVARYKAVTSLQASLIKAEKEALTAADVAKQKAEKAKALKAADIDGRKAKSVARAQESARKAMEAAKQKAREVEEIASKFGDNGRAVAHGTNARFSLEDPRFREVVNNGGRLQIIQSRKGTFRDVYDYETGERRKVRSSHGGWRIEGMPGEYDSREAAINEWRERSSGDLLWSVSDDGKYIEVEGEGDALERLSGRANDTGRAERWAQQRAENGRRIADDMAGELGVTVHYVDDMTDEERAALSDRQRRAKGWFDPRTGDVYINLGNHNRLYDIVSTVLHNVVANKGLRGLFGESFPGFLDQVYNNVDKHTRAEIDRIAERNDGDRRDATEEYLALMAERMDIRHPENYQYYNDAVRDFVIEEWKDGGLKWGHAIEDGDLRRVLFESYHNMRREGAMGVARSVAFRDQVERGRAAQNAAIPRQANAVAEDDGVRFSIRTKPAPKKTITVYKLMRLGDDGKLYPLYIDGAVPIELGQWYDADSPNMEMLVNLPAGVHLINPETGEATSLEDYNKQHGITKKSKYPSADAVNEATANGMRWVYIEPTKGGQRRFGGEARRYWNLGINGSGTVSTYSMRPGWHAGSLPTMRQIGKGSGRNLRDDRFVWVEGVVSADVDYNAEAQGNPDKDIPDRIPEDGYYLKSTNANADAAQADRVGWYVAGAFKPERIIGDREAREIIDRWNAEHHEDEPVEYDFPRESGKVFNAETMQLEDDDNGPDGPNGGKRYSIDEESQKIFDTAKRKFGETKDIREAGYVLPDGVMLDFSGRHELDPGTDSSFLAGRRTTDHRAINQISFVYDENGDEVDTGVSSDMSDFIRRGAIRIDNNAGSINLSAAPTMAQRRVLRELIRRNGGDVQVDFGDGWNSDHYVEYEEASAQRVLGDIDRYFDDGIKPEGNVRFSLAPTFYSNAAKAVEGVKQEKAKAEQWKAMLTKAGGIKAGEDKWMGLSTWLDEHKGETLTKEQVRQFVAENGIQMEETHYSEYLGDAGQEQLDKYRAEYADAVAHVDDIYKAKAERFSNYCNTMEAQYGEEWFGKMTQQERMTYNVLARDQQQADPQINDRNDIAFQEMVDRYGDDFGVAFEPNVDLDGNPTLLPSLDYNDNINDVARSFLGVGENTDELINQTRSRYTTEGLENKREIAFVVPGIEPYQENDEIHFGPENQGRAVMWVRFGETRDADGNRVLVIDEIQSNRHQDAREKGYKETANTKGYKVEKDEHGNYIVTNKDGETRTFQYYEVHSENEAKLYAAQLDQGIFHADGIPAAPFEKNWHEVAMKRMLRLAAEEGFDKVAWTTGEQQAERYNIGSTIDSIEVSRWGESYEGYLENKDERGIFLNVGNGDNIAIVVNREGIITEDPGSFGLKGKPLSEVVGRELAQKIITTETSTKIGGNDLRIGGEGMKGFYDQMLPRFMDKYGKRWGVKTGEVTLATPGKEVMHSVDVNEDMKRSVMQGQPLFSLGVEQERTLMGMHNITAEKLRSALKLGGLANPSMAVINTEVGGFTNFGEISLIPSADLIASRTGGNAGTWGADAYSPRFPDTHRRLGKGGDKKMRSWAKGLNMRKEMEYNTEEQFNDYYNGFNIRDNALVYPFLHEKGLSGEVDYYTHMNVDQRLEDDLREANGDAFVLLKRFDEDDEYKKKLTDIVVGDEVGKIHKKEGESFQEFRDRRREWAKQIRDGLTGEDGYINRNLADDLLYAQARAYRENGKFSESRTVSNAEQYIRDHGMEEEYKQYFEQKMQELGAETQVYAGSDSQGRSRYKPVSLDQVSRMMKKQGRAGGEGGIFADSPGAIRAKLLTPMKTLDQIRAKKDQLVSHEAFEQFRERYQEELREYADVYARGSIGALADIITSGNMAATAKRYNIDLDAEAVAELNKFKNRVRALPTEYFETKFERPVMLDEFKKAIIPDDLPLDLQGALQRAGLDVVEYKHGDNADRERVTLDAVKNDDSIRFSLSQRERDYTANVLKKLRKAGVNVQLATDEEAQRVLDTAEQVDAELMRGWHGSSADFDAFDHSHMGEGEGAQAYGWGTYITEVEGIARQYAGGKPSAATIIKLSNSRRAVQVLDTQVQGMKKLLIENTRNLENTKRWIDEAKKELADFIKRFGADSDEVSDWHRQRDEQMEFWQDDADSYKRGIKSIKQRLPKYEKLLQEAKDELNNLEEKFNESGGRFLYEVSIPENNGSNYLPYDQVLSEETSKRLVDAIKPLYEETRANREKYIEEIAAIREPAQQKFGDDWLKSLPAESQERFEELIELQTSAQKKEADLRSVLVYIDAGDELLRWQSKLEKALGKKETSEFLSGLGYVGVEYPAMFRSGGREDGAKNYVIFNEGDAKIVNKTEFLKTSDGTVYGWHDNDGIHLTAAGLNPNTPMHEYTHGLMAMLKEREPEKYQQIVEALKDSEVWQEVLNDELYSNIRDDVDAVASEVASRLSGRESERRANESMPARIKRAIQELWDAVAEWFGVKSQMAADSIARMTLRELERGTNPDGDGPGGGTNGGDGPRFSLSGDGTVEAYNKAVNMTGRTFNVGGREVKPGLTRYNFQEAFQDAILAVKKLQQVVERHFGIKLPTRENAWMYENRLSSINMHERKSFIDKVYEPMMKIADAIMKRGVKEKELNAYLICKHGLERNQVFAARDAQEEANEIARNGGTPDMQQLIDKYRQRDYSGLTGVTGIQGDITDIEAEAQRIVDEFEQKHGQLCDELWDAIRKATQWSLRKSYQSGMMSAATFDHVRNMFQYYIPLRGWSETTAEDVYSYMMGEHGAFNGVLKKAEGRTSVADDPLATIGNMAESALIQGNRNLLKQHLLRMAQNHPTDVCQVRDVWLVEGPGGVWEPHWPNIPDDATPDEIDQILQDHEADMQQLEASGQAKRVRNNLDIPYRIDPKHVPEHAVVAKVAGVDHVVFINGNPRAAQAINGQTGAGRGTKSGFSRLIDFIFGDVKRFYSSVLTSLNINFSGANFVRDLPHAYAMTFIKQGPLKAAEYIAKSFQVIPWVFKNQLGKTGTSQMDRYFQEFLSSGSVTGYAHINDVDAWKADNKRRFARLSALGKAKVAVPRALGEVINAIGWFSETLELIPRFTAFLAERQAGKDIATATKAAKDITTNFNKKGSEVTPGVWGAVANTLRYMKMFFNPIVQGMYQFVDVASMGKENKWVGPRMVLATMHLPVLGAIVPYLNQFLLEALGGDDDDDYWLINEYTRRNNVCIFTGNGYVKIPIAPVFREMYGMGEVVATRHAGKADNEKTVIDLIDQLRTMGSVEGQSSYNEWSLARFLLPEHFAPLIDVMNNENFTGGPIYYDNNYKEYAPEYTKAKKSTWSPLVAASKWLNEMMGGDEDIAADNSGKWMNPAVWQHLITNVGGGFAQLAGDVVAGVTDITEGKEIDPSNIPVLKRFYSGSSDERANWARFGIYKDFEKDYTLAKEKYQALDKRGLSLTERADEMVKFAESHPKAAAIYAVWEGGIKGADIPQQLSKLGKDDPKYWDLVKDAVAKAEKAMNSGYVRAWEQKRKDRPDSMSDKELNDRFDKSDNDSIRHIMADEISKRAGSQDYYGRDAQAAWSDKSVAAWEAYQDQRTSDDIKADAELSNLLKVDDDEKDKERIKMLGYIKDELNKIRRGKDATSRSAGVKGLGEGDDGRVMNELRAARKQLIEDLKNGSAEQAYRNLERRTMRLGLRKKAKEL